MLTRIHAPLTAGTESPVHEHVLSGLAIVQQSTVETDAPTVLQLSVPAIAAVLYSALIDHDVAGVVFIIAWIEHVERLYGTMTKVPLAVPDELDRESFWVSAVFPLSCPPK